MTATAAGRPCAFKLRYHPVYGEVTVDVEGVTFQRFEMRLDGPAGNLMRIRGHAEHADAHQAAEAFPGAEIVVVEDVVLVTVEVATSEAATPAPNEAARPLE